jgi:Calx-beta domain/Beta-propeller repeat
MLDMANPSDSSILSSQFNQSPTGFNFHHPIDLNFPTNSQLTLGLTNYPDANEIEAFIQQYTTQSAVYSNGLSDLIVKALFHPTNPTENTGDWLIGANRELNLVSTAALPTISLSVIDGTAAEKPTGQTQNPGQFKVTRSGDLTQASTVNYTISGTATPGTDYQPLTGSVTFAVGASQAYINVLPYDDLAKEGTESVIVTLVSDATKYTLGAAKGTVNIVDDDIATVAIQATDAAAAETKTGQTANPGRFTFKRVGGDMSQTLTVSYTVAGNAISGTDYVGFTNNVTFAAGSDTAYIDIKPIDDDIFEGSEKVTLSLAANANYLLGTSKVASVTIADNDLPTITITASDENAAEAIAGQPTNPGRFTLTRTGNTASTLVVSYTIAGTATNGNDYNSLTGTVTFAAGSATAVININPIDDVVFEGNENIILTLAANTKYTIGANNTAIVTIADNDLLQTVTIAPTDANAAETIVGQPTNPGRFTLTRTGNLSSALTVSYTIGGTATNGSDFGSLTGSVTFVAGSATAIIDINALDDSLVEGNETVVLTLANGNYIIDANNTATATIADNDTTPSAVQLVRQFGTSQKDIGVGIATDRYGNTYIAGYGLVKVSNIESIDAWLTKRDAAGNEIWTRAIRTPDIPPISIPGSNTYYGHYDDFVSNVAVDSAGNVYVGGTSQLTSITIRVNSPSDPSDDTVERITDSDMWLSKFTGEPQR